MSNAMAKIQGQTDTSICAPCSVDLLRRACFSPSSASDPSAAGRIDGAFSEKQDQASTHRRVAAASASPEILCVYLTLRRDSPRRDETDQGGKADKDVYDAGEWRPVAEQSGDEVEIEQADETPVQPANDEEGERGQVKNAP